MTTGAVSPRRADTRRGHERILAAATEALDTSGEVSFNAIAKRAGIGVGTVYRHFPTPEALVLAVYHREVRHLVDVVPDLLETSTPEQAFRAWTGHLAHYVMTKRALATALRTATPHDGNVHEDPVARAHAATNSEPGPLRHSDTRRSRRRSDTRRSRRLPVPRRSRRLPAKAFAPTAVRSALPPHRRVSGPLGAVVVSAAEQSTWSA